MARTKYGNLSAGKNNDTIARAIAKQAPILIF